MKIYGKRDKVKSKIPTGYVSEAVIDRIHAEYHQKLEEMRTMYEKTIKDMEDEHRLMSDSMNSEISNALTKYYELKRETEDLSRKDNLLREESVDEILKLSSELEEEENPEAQKKLEKKINKVIDRTHDKICKNTSQKLVRKVHDLNLVKKKPFLVSEKSSKDGHLKGPTKVARPKKSVLGVACR